MTAPTEQKPERGTRALLHEIIFEAETPAGRAFDVVLLWAVLISVAVAALETVGWMRARHGTGLRILEWGFTVAFTVEYLLRIYSVKRPILYMTSFFGLIDLLAIVPSYASLVLPGAQSLLVVRIVRLLRIFRVLKLVSFLGEAQVLLGALQASRRKITVFLLGVLSVVVIVASLMYLIEGPENGFDNIPRSMYWAIVTLTTVGFGDITPKTVAGQMVASLLMIMGYGIIAVPTGIVSVELANAARHPVSTRSCPSCGSGDHDGDADYCKRCGERLK